MLRSQDDPADLAPGERQSIERGPLRVAIVGTGGVGGLLGALLARQGGEVTFVATEPTAVVLNKQGLSVRSERYGSFVVGVHAVTELDRAVDACVVAVKATHLSAAMGRVPETAVRDAIVVPFLNGVEHVETLRAHYGGRVVPGTLRVASRRTAPGVIEHTSPFMNAEMAVAKEGEADRTKRVSEFADCLRTAGVDVKLRDDEATMLWTKLIFLCPLALLTTTYGGPAGEIRTAHRDELISVIEEVAQVAGSAGAALDTHTAIDFFDSVPPTMESSMQHDAVMGTPIEIEAIGGAVLRAAVRAQIPTPVTKRLVEHLRAQPAGFNQSTRDSPGQVVRGT